jgi:hypothetical protein
VSFINNAHAIAAAAVQAKLHEAQGERSTAAHYYALNLARLDAERVQGGDVTEALLFLAEYTKVLPALPRVHAFTLFFKTLNTRACNCTGTSTIAKHSAD